MRYKYKVRELGPRQLGMQKRYVEVGEAKDMEAMSLKKLKRRLDSKKEYHVEYIPIRKVILYLQQYLEYKVSNEEKVITIKPKGITQKQWSILLLELNMMKNAWRPYGVRIELSAPGLKRVVEWGTKKYGIDHSK